jgi:hypothetical protein
LEVDNIVSLEWIVLAKDSRASRVLR